MHKLRTLYIEFDAEISGHELPAFRAAISKKAGEENILFHNHREDGKLMYRYPFIQYKRNRKHPVIFCLGEGVDEIHHFFENKDWTIHLSGRSLDMKIRTLHMNQFNLGVWKRLFNYNIRNWIALNSVNYSRYNELKDEQSEILFLENLLKANILSFAKGVGWEVDQALMLRINKRYDNGLVTLKGRKMSAFNLDFSCNVSLPPFIGLGKSVSLGFGLVRDKRNANINTEQSKST